MKRALPVSDDHLCDKDVSPGRPRRLSLRSQDPYDRCSHSGVAWQYAQSRFKYRASPSCICDLECEETAAHILIECPANEHDRFEYESKIDMKMERESIKEIMQRKRARRHFLKYAKEVTKQSTEA
jgi:hypothetical protein